MPVNIFKDHHLLAGIWNMCSLVGHVGNLY